jgi:hypothetical protein
MCKTLRDLMYPTVSTTPLPNQRTHPLAYVLAGGLIAGTLDILYAYTFWAVKNQIPALRRVRPARRPGKTIRIVAALRRP